MADVNVSLNTNVGVNAKPDKGQYVNTNVGVVCQPSLTDVYVTCDVQVGVAIQALPDPGFLAGVRYRR